MAQNDNSDAIARAWHLHRDGRQNDAIKEYDAILRTSPGDLDAHYGIALAQRSAGMLEASLESWKQAGTAISRALEAEPNKDRYLMLQRMVQQRIAEMHLRASNASK